MSIAMKNSISLILVTLILASMACSSKKEIVMPDNNLTIEDYANLTLQQYAKGASAECYSDKDMMKLGFSKCTRLIAQRDINHFSKVIEIDPGSYNAFMCRAFCKHLLKDYHGAVQDYEKVVELNPNYVLAYENMGMVKSYLHDYQGARNDLTRAIELNPRSRRAHKLLRELDNVE
jgi:tetratricopeptide (TPR) repeat protein